MCICRNAVYPCTFLCAHQLLGPVWEEGKCAGQSFGPPLIHPWSFRMAHANNATGCQYGTDASREENQGNAEWPYPGIFKHHPDVQMEVQPLPLRCAGRVLQAWHLLLSLYSPVLIPGCLNFLDHRGMYLSGLWRCTATCGSGLSEALLPCQAEQKWRSWPGSALCNVSSKVFRSQRGSAG